MRAKLCLAYVHLPREQAVFCRCLSRLIAQRRESRSVELQVVEGKRVRANDGKKANRKRAYRAAGCRECFRALGVRKANEVKDLGSYTTGTMNQELPYFAQHES